MNETLIPWDFLGLLLGIFAVTVIFVCGLCALKAHRRARLTSSGKDYVYRTKPTREVRE